MGLTHLPSTHAPALSHLVPQPPQLFASAVVSMQLPEHSVPVMHMQVPLLQVWPVPHVTLEHGSETVPPVAPCPPLAPLPPPVPDIAPLPPLAIVPPAPAETEPPAPPVAFEPPVVDPPVADVPPEPPVLARLPAVPLDVPPLPTAPELPPVAVAPPFGAPAEPPLDFPAEPELLPPTPCPAPEASLPGGASVVPETHARGTNGNAAKRIRVRFHQKCVGIIELSNTLAWRRGRALMLSA